MRRASDKCQKEKRKTINGDDLLWAMATLGFEDYIDPLKIYLARYREVNHSTCSIAKKLYDKIKNLKIRSCFVCLLLEPLLHKFG